MPLEIRQIDMLQSLTMRRAENDARRGASLQSLLPAISAQAPAVAGLQAGKTEFRSRCRQVIAHAFREFEESRS